MKQIMWWGPTDIGHHCRKCCLGELAPVLCAPLHIHVVMDWAWAQNEKLVLCTKLAKYRVEGNWSNLWKTFLDTKRM